MKFPIRSVRSNPSLTQIGSSSQSSTKQSLAIPLQEERTRFKITVPDGELCDLKREFLMIIDEDQPPSSPPPTPTSPLASPLHKLRQPPPPPPLKKFIAYGAPSETNEGIYRIRFYEADATSGQLKEGFAAVEWLVERGDKEVYYYDGRVSYEDIGLDNQGIGEFIRKRGEYRRVEEVLVGNVGGVQKFEDIIRRDGVSEHHFSAVSARRSVWTSRQSNKQASYSASIDLWKPCRESGGYEGLIEFGDLPHHPKSRSTESPLMKPLLVWLVLNILQRATEEFLVYEIDGVLVDVIPSESQSLSGCKVTSCPPE